MLRVHGTPLHLGLGKCEHAACVSVYNGSDNRPLFLIFIVKQLYTSFTLSRHGRVSGYHGLN